MDALMGSLVEYGKGAIQSVMSENDNLRILENKVEELICRESDVQAELKRAKVLYGQKPKNEVELWLSNVQKIKIEVCDIKQKVEEMRWYSQINLAKLVEEKIKEVNELKANGPILNGLFVEEIATKIFPPIKLVGEETALKNLKKIEECLIDDKVGSIGVFGMGGVGKTTIMTQIHNKLENANTFDRVIWVTVSRDSYLEKLQYDISRTIGLRLSNDDAIGRSAELFRAFNNIGRFLLILDDMWKAFPLEKLGIPEPNEKNKCKIVCTTRSRNVCRGIGSQKTVKVDVLTKDESWTLFKEKLGSNQELSQEIEPIAKTIVEECDGLPLAIITVGRAMRDVDEIRRWRIALEDLKNSRTEIEGMDDDVFPCLKFSFDKLKTQRLQDCFLYCALYPEDYEIFCDDLIEYWMADGLLDEMEDREMGFDRGHAIIHDLIDACMLERAGNYYVKMHDLLRDLAISITSKSSRFVVKVGFRGKQFLWDENLMTGAVRVNFSSSDVERLSCQPNSPELSTLLLTFSKLHDIHPLFFEHMHKLRVLDLSRSESITSLPQSISNLEKLHGLWLRDCTKLKEVPSLAKLKELMVLDLSRTAIEYLPEGMACLTNLRRFDLSLTNELKMFPAGIVPNLHLLEELRTVGSKWKWSANIGKERGACVEEMLRLTHLRKLYVTFTDLNGFHSYVRSGLWRDLKHCFLQINANVGGERYLDDIHAVDIEDVTRCMRSLDLPGNTTHLHFGRISCDDIHCDHITSLSEVTSMWSLEQLEACVITLWPTIKYVLTKEENHPFLPTLDRLYLEDLCNLRCICKELTPTQSGTLANLTEITINECPKLKHGFSVEWLQNLQHLQHMAFESCKELEEIVMETKDVGESSHNNNNTITLPSLKRLELTELPKLKNICKRMFICHSLEEIDVDCCPNLKMLPLSINNMPPTFKAIRGSTKWWNSLEWDKLDTQSHLQHFFSNRDLVSGEIEDSSDEDDDEVDKDNNDALVDTVEDDNGTKDGIVDANDAEEERRGTKRKCRDGDVSTSRPELSPLPPADHNEDI